MTTTLIFSQFLIGMSLAANLFIIASGLTLIFGLLRVINFAHASMYALGAYFCFSAASISHNFWVGVAASVIVMMIIGAVLEISLLRRVYGHEHIYQLLLTFALILFLTDLEKIVWGPYPITTSLPPIFAGWVSIMGATVPKYSLFVIGVGLFVAMGLWSFLYKTKWGCFIRVAAFDREMTDALGVNVSRLYTVVFTIGAGLGGLGGAIASPNITIVPDMGMLVIIDCFAVIIIGGVGSLLGAGVGSLIIGLWGAIGLLIVPQFAMVFTFALMAIVLLIRPWGIFGERS